MIYTTKLCIVICDWILLAMRFYFFFFFKNMLKSLHCDDATEADLQKRLCRTARVPRRPPPPRTGKAPRSTPPPEPKHAYDTPSPRSNTQVDRTYLFTDTPSLLWSHTALRWRPGHDPDPNLSSPDFHTQKRPTSLRAAAPTEPSPCSPRSLSPGGGILLGGLLFAAQSVTILPLRLSCSGCLS